MRRHPIVDVKITHTAVDRIIKAVVWKGDREHQDRIGFLRQLHELKQTYFWYCAEAARPPAPELRKHVGRIRTALETAQDLLPTTPQDEASLVMFLDLSAKDADRVGSLRARVQPGASSSPVAESLEGQLEGTNAGQDGVDGLRQALSRWRAETSVILDAIGRLHAFSPLSKAEQEYAFFEDVVLNRKAGLNRFRTSHSPEVKLIAYDIYIHYQWAFDAPVTWPNDLNGSPTGGPAVRFATEVLREFGITNPKTGEAFTPGQIIGIWERHCGRSEDGAPPAKE